MDAPTSILEDALLWQQHHLEVYRAQQRLRAYCLEHGPIRLPSGAVVGLYSNGNEWDHHGIAHDFPNLIQEQTTALVGTPADVERGLSIAMEEVPALKVGTTSYAIDRDAANGVLKAGGEASEKLKENIHRKQGRLEAR